MGKVLVTIVLVVALVALVHGDKGRRRRAPSRRRRAPPPCASISHGKKSSSKECNPYNSNMHCCGVHGKTIECIEHRTNSQQHRTGKWHCMDMTEVNRSLKDPFLKKEEIVSEALKTLKDAPLRDPWALGSESVVKA